MRTFLSLSLLGAGLFMAMHLLFPDPRSSREDLIAATRAQAPIGYRVVRAPDSGQARSFSPSTPLFSSGSQVPEPVLARPEPSTATRASSEPASPAPVVARRVLTPAPVLVRPARSSRQVLNAAATMDPPRRGMASAEPADPSARYALVRDLQRELKRAGCYYGKVDGSWGPGSKYALGRFNKIVNSALDAENPNYIQLALVRAHADGVCRQDKSKTIVADNASGITPPLPVPLAKLDRNANRVAASGPVSGSVTRQLTTGSTRIGAWTTRVNEPPKLVRNPTLVTRETNRPKPRRLATPKRRGPAPEGRMALAGPRPNEAPTIVRDSSITQSTATRPATKKRSSPSVERRRSEPRKSKAAAKRKAKYKRSKKRSKRRYSKRVRQRRLMREAFGDSMF